MTARRTESLLGLAIPVDSGFSAGSSLAPWSPGHALTSNHQRILDESHDQQLTMWAQEEKTTYGITLMAELEKHGASTFVGTAGFLMELKDQPGRSKEFQSYVDEYIVQVGIRGAARHIAGTVEVGAAQIARIVHQSPVPPPQPEPLPKQRSLREVLFG